jgi:hypothetical protein
MRCHYSIAHPGQGEAESLPRLPLVLHYGEQQLELVGLVDSGATVNVLPYTVGLQLGAVWDAAKSAHYAWRKFRRSSGYAVSR